MSPNGKQIKIPIYERISILYASHAVSRHFAIFEHILHRVDVIVEFVAMDCVAPSRLQFCICILRANRFDAVNPIQTRFITLLKDYYNTNGFQI